MQALFCQERREADTTETPFFIRAAAQATESIEVAVNEPFPLLADSST